jgi:integrase
MEQANQGHFVYALSTSQALERYSNNSSKDVFLRDARLRGFGVRITPGNTKSFFVESRQGSTGRVRRIVLGQFPVMTLKDARRRAIEALRELRYGDGTLGTREITLRTIFEGFLEAKAPVLRERSVRDYRMVFYSRRRGQAEGSGQGCFPAWMDSPVTAITGKAVVERYRALCQERGVGTANKAMRVLNGTLNYAKAIYPGLQDWTNPVSVLTVTRCRIALKPRTRHIPIEKLGAWLAAVEAESDRDIALLFKLMLMTGLRSKEARSLRWTQVNLEQGSMTIGSDQAKNHQEVTLPLNSWLRSQLAARRQTTDANAYVFENKNVKDGYVRNLKRPLERISKRSGVHFTPHDLRRSFATYLDTVGAPFGVIKQLLNHKTKSDVTERYIQSRNISELRRHSEAVLELITSTRWTRGQVLVSIRFQG